MRLSQDTEIKRVLNGGILIRNKHWVLHQFHFVHNSVQKILFENLYTRYIVKNPFFKSFNLI